MPVKSAFARGNLLPGIMQQLQRGWGEVYGVGAEGEVGVCLRPLQEGLRRELFAMWPRLSHEQSSALGAVYLQLP